MKLVFKGSILFIFSHEEADSRTESEGTCHVIETNWSKIFIHIGDCAIVIFLLHRD